MRGRTLGGEAGTVVAYRVMTTRVRLGTRPPAAAGQPRRGLCCSILYSNLAVVTCSEQGKT